MGCGRSTMGSDSPNGNSNKDDDGSLDVPAKTANSLHGQVIPFSPGGPLLAQAKVSESQMDFFKILDEKIENGADFDSDAEELIEKSHLQKCLQEWNKLTRDKTQDSSDRASSGNRPPSTSRSEAWSDPDEPAQETVKEQYMFMGNLYTLTRLSSDGSQVQQEVVDVIPAPASILDESMDTVAPIVATIVPSQDGVTKVNGTSSNHREERVVRRLERADTPFHSTITPKSKIPPRPASLVLKTVFPAHQDA